VKAKLSLQTHAARAFRQKRWLGAVKLAGARAKLAMFTKSVDALAGYI
jgi:hypothetical protein